MKRATAFLAAIALFAVCSAVFAEYSIDNKGHWPDSWPKELEPLRKQAETWVGPMPPLQHYLIPFTKREEFESAWPHILKVKSKGAPIILIRGPKTDLMGLKPAGVLIHSPPERTDKRAHPEEPMADWERYGNVRVRWMWTTYIELVVDGKIVDLNRIPLPADTPIIDERFKDEPPPATGELPAREKMLIRYILQNEFTKDLGRHLEGQNDLAKMLQTSSHTQKLESIARTDDAKLRLAVILELGIPGHGDYGSVKVRETIKRAIKSESDKWVKLEMARVLASFGDDAGKNVLVSALVGREGYMTQSEIEVGKAVLPLLLLDYDFPGGFSKTVIVNYEWGGIHEYFDAIRKERAKLHVEDVRSLLLANPEGYGSQVRSTEGQASAKRPTPKAAARRDQLRKAVKSFRLQLEYNGDQDKPYYNLTLTVPGVAHNSKNAFYPQVQIAEELAQRIIEYLATEGFLDQADDLKPGAVEKFPAPTMPGYSMKVTTEQIIFLGDLGWKMPMLNRMERLRKIMDGDAATQMDLLLGRMTGHRTEWEKERQQ